MNNFKVTAVFPFGGEIVKSTGSEVDTKLASSTLETHFFFNGVK